MKKLFTLFLAFVASAGILFADEAVQIGELYYHLNNSNWTAEVTNNGTDPNYELSTITIPSSVSYLSYTYAVTSIGSSAFEQCFSLTSITIPNSVTSIGRFAFWDCSSLLSIEIPNTIICIEESTFFDCSSLTSVTIPNSVTDIGAGAFWGCSSLQSIEIPNSVTSIGEVTFWDCSSLTSVIIPNSVTNIGEDAFTYCNSLESIVVETGNVVYDNRDNCNAIIETATNKLIIGCQSTTIPNSVTSIGNWAFWGCSGLISITIPSSLTSIGDGAFSGCSGLMSISVEAGNSVYDSRDNCNAIIETATNTLFRGCKGTTIPSSVTSIGAGAFNYSG